MAGMIVSPGRNVNWGRTRRNSGSLRAGSHAAVKAVAVFQVGLDSRRFLRYDISCQS